MAIGLNGDANNIHLVSGLDVERLRVVTAFGTSMLPFLKPGAELRLETVEPETIRLGDIITYRLHPGVLVTHRVVKILSPEGSISFLTKGDHRVHCDSQVVFGYQIIGKVSQVDQKKIRSFFWRALGRLVATISYAQANGYRTLANSPLNRFRRALIKKGGWPKGWLRPFFVQFFRGFLYRRRLPEGVTIEAWQGRTTKKMAEIWNENFPNHPTESSRLDQAFQRRLENDFSNCFMVKTNEDLSGWSLVHCEQRRFQGQDLKVGVIDVLVLVASAWEKEIDYILLENIIRWFKAKGARQIFLESYHASENSCGVPMTSLLRLSSKFRFVPDKISIELSLTPEIYRQPEVPMLPEKLEIGPWKPKYEAAIRDFILRNVPSDSERYNNLSQLSSLNDTGVFIATLQGSVVGFCCCAIDDGLRDDTTIPKTWIYSKPAHRRGFILSQWTEKICRGQGIDAALVAHVIQYLLNQSCREILTEINDDKSAESFYHSFGFRKMGHIVRSRQAEQG